MRDRIVLALTFLCMGTLTYAQSQNHPYPYPFWNYPGQLFGSKTPYYVAQGHDLGRLRGHEIVQIFGIIRHGTRNASESDNNDMQVLHNIKQNIGEDAQISQEDYTKIVNWVNLADDNKNLIDQGRVDMRRLANRLRENFYSIFSGQFNFYEYRVLASPEERARDSAVAFLNKAFNINLEDVPQWGTQDVTLNIDKLRENLKKNKNKQQIVKESDKFKAGEKMQQTLLRVTQKLNYASLFSYDDVRAMYEACRHDFTRDLRKTRQSIPAWCRVFTHEDILNFEYLDDLVWNEKYGYNSHYGDKLGCPLMMRIMMNFEAALSNSGVKAVLTFGHRSNIFPALTMLGLAYDNEPLTAYNMDNMSNRNWRTSFLNPFASNVLLVLSKSNGEFYVSVFVNEHIVPLTMENNSICTTCEWSLFKMKYDNYMLRHQYIQFENTGCNFGHNITPF